MMLLCSHFNDDPPIQLMVMCKKDPAFKVFQEEAKKSLVKSSTEAFNKKMQGVTAPAVKSEVRDDSVLCRPQPKVQSRTIDALDLAGPQSWQRVPRAEPSPAPEPSVPPTPPAV